MLLTLLDPPYKYIIANKLRMNIIPVLDLKNRQIVRGMAGRREIYQPIVSKLTPSVEPLAVANAIRAHFKIARFYLADLDAIAGQSLASDVYDVLQSSGFSLWVDAGVRTCPDAEAVARSGVANIIIGLETLEGFQQWQACVQRFGPNRLVFSLDLYNGKPMKSNEWNSEDVLGIVDQVMQIGCQRMIVLDVARVGMDGGIGTESVCRQILAKYPQTEVILGGGIRNREDLQQAANAGATGVLIASALHDGRIGEKEIEEYDR